MGYSPKPQAPSGKSQATDPHRLTMVQWPIEATLFAQLHSFDWLQAIAFEFCTLFTLHGWISVLVVSSVFLTLFFHRRAPVDLLFLTGMVVVTVTGVITPEQAVAGFSNPAVLMIGALLVVSAALRHTGVLDWVGHHWLGRFQSERGAMWSLALGLVSVSAFLLNTALVAMAMPVVLDWCRKRGVSPSRLLMPVSYFAILGGVCTMIGTSTTLVVRGEMQREYERPSILSSPVLAEDGSADNKNRRWTIAAFHKKLAPMQLVEIGKVGLPCAIVGTLVLVVFGRRLFPNRTDMIEQLGEKRREYLVEMLVLSDCRLIEQSIEDAGLRHLPGLFLIEIFRDGEVITPVTPSDVIRSGDRLIFTGVVSTILDLERIPGLVPAADTTYEFSPVARHQRNLTEVVLSRTSPLIGTTVREARFRQLYNAAVVAVHRNGMRLTNKIGDIVLEPGDTLLLQTRANFVTRHRNSRDFYLVSSVEGDEPRRHDRALLAGLLALLLVAWLTWVSYWGHGYAVEQGWSPTWVAIWKSVSSPEIVGIAAALLMIVTRCLHVSHARAAIDFHILFVIVGALALGKALKESEAAGTIAHGLVTPLVELLGVDNPWLPWCLLLAMYLVTIVFTEMITNNAVAAMLFPIALALAWEADLNPRPFVMAVALAASLSFITPIGYQTNLMVMGPGGYYPRDYLRAGLPILIAVTITALYLIPKIWPFF